MLANGESIVREEEFFFFVFFLLKSEARLCTSNFSLFLDALLQEGFVFQVSFASLYGGVAYHPRGGCA